MDELLLDNIARLKAAQGAKGSNPKNAIKVLSLAESVANEFPDRTMQKRLFDSTLTPVISKLVTTTDIGQLRNASIADIASLANEYVPMLRFLETQRKGIFRITDPRIEIPEERIGSDVAEKWNPMGALPGEAKMNRPVRFNTFSCVGNTVNVALITEEIAQQQAGISQMQKELSYEKTRIRVLMDSMLTSNTEVTFEELPNIPQNGGFVTRSTLFNVSASSSDLTRALIQGRVDAISNVANLEGRGYDVQLIGMTNARQLQVIKDIIVQEYNGIYPTDRLAFEQSLAAQVAEAGLRSSIMFESTPGRVIPFFLNATLPAGTTVIFEPQHPQLAKMQLGGTYGPFAMLRPTERLQSLNVVFDLFSLVDPLLETRSLITSTL